MKTTSKLARLCATLGRVTLKGTATILAATLVATLAGAALFAPAAQAQTWIEPVRGGPLVIWVAEDSGWAYRTPFRPDLIVRQGSGRNCDTTYEQTMTAEGLVWRPLIMCPIED